MTQNREQTLLRNGGNFGYSLIEVLVSLGIFSATIFAYLYQVSTAYHMMGSQMRRAAATTLLENVVEDAMIYPKGSCQWIWVGNFFCHNRFYASDSRQVYFTFPQNDDFTNNMFYNIHWEVTEETPIGGMVTADFSIEWTEEGEAKKVQMRVVR